MNYRISLPWANTCRVTKRVHSRASARQETRLPQSSTGSIVEINAAFSDPKIKAWLADQGGTVLPGSPADFGKLIVDETEKWSNVIKFAGIKTD